MVIKPRNYFLFKLFLFSTAAHGLLLCLLLVVLKQQGPLRLTISGVATDIDWSNVVMMPLTKTVPGVQAKIAQVAQKKEIKPKAEPKKAPSVQPKVVAQKKVQPQTSSANSSPTFTQAAQTPVPQLAEKKVIPPVVAKNEPPKKVEAAQKKIIETTPQTVANAVVAKTVEPEKIYVGRNDRELLYVQQELYTQLAKNWKSPVGMPSDAVCSIKAVIAKDGTVQDVVMDSSSNILVFDVTARMAILETEFPQSVWGKEIIITFNQ